MIFEWFNLSSGPSGVRVSRCNTQWQTKGWPGGWGDPERHLLSEKKK